MEAVSDLEEKLENAKNRLADLEGDFRNDGTFGGDYFGACDDLRKIVKDLGSKLKSAKDRELRKEFGLPLDDEQPRATAINPPRRISDARTKKQYESPYAIDEEAAQQYGKIFEAHWSSDAIESVEDRMFNCADDFAKRGANPQVTFTQGLYAALVLSISETRCQIESYREFMMVRRRQIEDRLDALERDREQLRKDVSNFTYCGVWSMGKAYAKGNSVTDGGSLWIALQDTALKPGIGGHWQLAVKRGKDAR
jgi:hypothetical protein